MSQTALGNALIQLRHPAVSSSPNASARAPVRCTARTGHNRRLAIRRAARRAGEDITARPSGYGRRTPHLGPRDIGVEALAKTPARSPCRRPPASAEPRVLVIELERSPDRAPCPRPKVGVLLEQALLHVEAEILGFVIARRPDPASPRGGKASTWPLAVQHVVRGSCPGSRDFWRSRIFGGQTSSVVKRLENSITCQRSERATRPADGICWRQNWVRRSALP